MNVACRALVSVALVFAWLWSADWAVAQSYAGDELHLEQRLDQIEAQLARLRYCNPAGSCRGESCSPSAGGFANSYCSAEYRHCGGFYAGGALIFAKPHFKEAFQIAATNTGTGQQTLIPFSYDYDPTPEMWLGYDLPGGLGIRGRYWQFDQSAAEITRVSDGQTVYTANATTVIFPATIIADDAGEVLQSNDRLRTEIVDSEATLRMCIGRTELTGGAGLRYAHLTQSLSSTAVTGLGVPVGVLQWTRDFEGLGPVISVHLQRPLGDRGLAAFAKGSGSLLFGHKSLERTVVGDVSTPTAAPLLSLRDADEVVPMGELALGLQWTRPFGRSQLVVSGQYQGQLWAEAGAPTLGFLGFEGFGFQVELRL
jgi:hypothetical protein